MKNAVDLFNVRWFALAAGVLVALGAYVSFSNNRFTTTNVFLWLWALAAFVIAFWLPGQRKQGRRFHIRRGWLLLLLAALGLVVFFRMYQFSAVPSQMVSDQAEKLFDVADILNGQWSIFFPRNTGREAFQFYLTAAIAKWLDTGISFTSLKIGTVLAGLLTLPFIYLLGKELGNRQIGLLAMVFAGIAYWPNIISRFGLRFPFYPFFAAPTLYYLIRGLRTRNRNDFILTGLWLGVGLHGYTPFRIMPFVVVAAIGLYLLHRQARGRGCRRSGD